MNEPRMLVGGETSASVWPNSGFDVSLTGNAKFGWLNRLKNWNPIPSLPRSQCGIEVFLKIVKSVFTYCGPRKWFRNPATPKPVSQPGIGNCPCVVVVQAVAGVVPPTLAV